MREGGVGRRKGLLKKGILEYGGVFRRNGLLAASTGGGGGRDFEEFGIYFEGLLKLGGGMFGLKSVGSDGGEEALAEDRGSADFLHFGEELGGVWIGTEEAWGKIGVVCVEIVEVGGESEEVCVEIEDLEAGGFWRLETLTTSP